MAANEMEDFKHLLKSVRELGALAIKGTVALPLLNIWLRIGPPPTVAVAALTSGMQFLGILLAFNFWRRDSKKSLNRKICYCAMSAVIGIAMFGVLMQQFTIRAGSKNERVIEGYSLKADIRPLIGPGVSPLDALHDAGYDSTAVWTKTSIDVVQILLIAAWLHAFISFAMLVSAFVIVQRQHPAMAARRRKATPAKRMSQV